MSVALDQHRRHDRYGDYIHGGEVYDDGSSFHPIDEVLDTEYRVKTLVDLDGHVVTEGLDLHEDDILQEECFEDLEAEEEYEGYIGNSGPTATHWYRVTAVVIVPRDTVLSFLTPKYPDSSFISRNLKRQVNYLARVCLQLPATKCPVEALVARYEEAWSGRKRTVYHFGPPEPWIDGDVIENVFRAAIRHGRIDFFEKAATHHEGLLPPTFFIHVREWLNAGCSGAMDRFSTMQTAISSAISSHLYFVDKFTAIRNLVPIPNEPSAPDTTSTPDYLLDWARSTIRCSLDASTPKSLGSEDGAAMVDAALYFDDRSAFISQVLAPVISQRRSAAAFFLALLDRLQQQSSGGILSMEPTMQLHKAEARLFIASVDFIHMHGDAGVQATPAKKASHALAPAQQFARRIAVSHKALAGFFSAIIQTSTEEDNLVTALISRLVAHAPGLPAAEFHSLWLPFLHCLIPILVSKKTPLNTTYCQQLFSALLKNYVDRYVGREPTNDTNLARPAVDCSCNDCAS